MKGVNPETGEEDVRKASDDEPFSALAFKIATDPFVGKVVLLQSVFRYTKCWCVRFITLLKDNTERIGRILQMHANHSTRY